MGAGGRWIAADGCTHPHLIRRLSGAAVGHLVVGAGHGAVGLGEAMVLAWSVVLLACFLGACHGRHWIIGG